MYLKNDTLKIKLEDIFRKIQKILILKGLFSRYY